MKQDHVIIGKRIPIGTAITGTAALFAVIFPDYAAAILATAIPLTFVVQVLWVNYRGVTQ